AIEPVATLFDRFEAAGAVGTTDGDVARHPHHPAHYRDAEDRLLGQPLHLPGEVADEEDVRHRLVVRDRHVGMPRIFDADTRRPEIPERVQFHRRYRRPAEPPTGLVAA